MCIDIRTVDIYIYVEYIDVGRPCSMCFVTGAARVVEERPGVKLRKQRLRS